MDRITVRLRSLRQWCPVAAVTVPSRCRHGAANTFTHTAAVIRGRVAARQDNQTTANFKCNLIDE
ncbi:MAG: hypothetical protein CBB71_14070 [Rhodopirellula sp. TMED11]|nr:MAG: hypothetical protein CBB71_14070 [Rhodopirellula sp. TMED11]